MRLQMRQESHKAVFGVGGFRPFSQVGVVVANDMINNLCDKEGGIGYFR